MYSGRVSKRRGTWGLVLIGGRRAHDVDPAPCSLPCQPSTMRRPDWQHCMTIFSVSPNVCVLISPFFAFLCPH
jgi:hypothetical protein